MCLWLQVGWKPQYLMLDESSALCSCFRWAATYIWWGYVIASCSAINDLRSHWHERKSIWHMIFWNTNLRASLVDLRGVWRVVWSIVIIICNNYIWLVCLLFHIFLLSAATTTKTIICWKTSARLDNRNNSSNDDTKLLQLVSMSSP